MTKSSYINTITALFFFFGCNLFCLAAFAFSNLEGIQTYQKTNQFREERKQSIAADLDRINNADNMWLILGSQFVLPHYESNPLVQQQIEWFMNHKDFLLHSATRAAPYLYYISKQIRKRHLPPELVLLPMIESAYNPFAYSTAGAAGIWQMMPGTASGYGIKQNWWYDGRRDVIASTQAALNYLTYLGGFFDSNWLLAIAAYDTGEGNVLSAIRRNVRDGQSTDFWSLPVAQETKDYVPRLLALATIIANPDRYPVDFPPVSDAPYLAQIDVGGQIDLKHAAQLAGLSLQRFKQLNPGFNHMATGPNGPYKMILPIENVEEFTENLLHSPLEKQINWNLYKVREGDTVFAIAKKFNTTPASIKQINALSSNALKPGSALFIPHDKKYNTVDIEENLKSFPLLSEKSSQKYYEAKQESGMLLKNMQSDETKSYSSYGAHYTLQPGDTLYMFRRGDTLLKIATRFHTSVTTLLDVNQIHYSQSIPVGTHLIIPTHDINNGSQHYELASGDTLYMVRPGDTLIKIANRFHTTIPSIRLANLLADNTVQEGDRLIIPTHG